MKRLERKNFDLVVIGGGHAGIEAAVSAGRMGCRVALVTMDKKAIGRMSCNPAIGGTAKGHLVREIDALGGVMGRLADNSGIQFRMLNRSKGPAIWSPRSQNDREIYSSLALQLIEQEENISILEKSVVEISICENKVSGVIDGEGNFISAKCVVLCSGTFLNALMHTGLSSVSGGRFGELPATGITASLNKFGFESGRLKTGTPPRLNKGSINCDVLEVHSGDENPQPFSFRTEKKYFPKLPQISCHITYTNELVHKILEKGFAESPMFTGRIQGIGPRYCPSIEDKVVRFSDKLRHQLFLEPEGLDSELIYLNGFSTSLPAEIQLEALHQIKGLENADMIRPGYAVEYDFFPPHQVDLTLETKKIEGLFFAGQINGTSGYEEAAAQGLVAGINAARKIRGENDFILKRSEAYIGVLIDDLVNKSTEEPYRMFTSRAEHRLLLRQDNSDQRLSKYGFEFGLITKEEFEKVEERKHFILVSVQFLEEKKVAPKEANLLLTELNSGAIDSSETIAKLCRRPELQLTRLKPLFEKENIFTKVEDELLYQIETEIKYNGYIKRQYDMVEKLERYESLKIPLNLNYLNLKSLSAEGKEKLQRIKPRTIGQASRISGVTPSDISVLLIYLKK